MSEEKKKSAVSQFTAFFDAKVMRLALAVEKKRNSYMTICLVIALIGTVISLCTFIFAPIAPIVTFMFLVVMPVMSLREMYGYEAKTKLLPALLSFWGKYDFIPKRLYITTHLFFAMRDKTALVQAVKDYFTPRYSRDFDYNTLARLYRFDGYRLEDCITGTFNNLKMQVCEMNLYSKSTTTDSDGKTSTRERDLFKGVVLAAEMSKPFKCVIGISKRNLNKRQLVNPTAGIDISLENITRLTGIVSKGIGVLKEAQRQSQTEESANAYAQKQEEARQETERQEKNCNRVVLEDVEFEKHFKTFSTDQIEARYILTTAFMERFKKIASKHKYKIEALFVNQKIFILIESYKNWFEVPFLNSATNINNYKKVISEISGLLAALDTLKLEQNIGM